MSGTYLSDRGILIHIYKANNMYQVHPVIQIWHWNVMIVFGSNTNCTFYTRNTERGSTRSTVHSQNVIIEDDRSIK
jgi:hypothetical protein